jgi:hypothetical protein
MIKINKIHNLLNLPRLSMNEFVYVLKPPANSPLALNDVGHYVKKGATSSSVFFLRVNKEILIENALVATFDINKTGDDTKFKVCDRCFKHLLTSENFDNNRIKKHSITKRPSCKECRKVKDGISVSPSDRRSWGLKKPKNSTLFKCPICTKTTIAGISKIVLDHCHHTGKVRGYLCESCNTGIGRFDDDPKLIARAKKWIEDGTQ